METHMLYNLQSSNTDLFPLSKDKMYVIGIHLSIRCYDKFLQTYRKEGKENPKCYSFFPTKFTLWGSPLSFSVMNTDLDGDLTHKVTIPH